jgi:hypothetical protein
MASELRRMAQALVERRRETFESLHPLEESKARLAQALAHARLRGAVVYAPQWRVADGHAVLDMEFSAPPRVQRRLKLFSVALSTLVLCSLWLVVADAGEGTLRFLFPLFTLLAVLAFPFVAVALGSHREAEEARIRRALRAALRDEESERP